jgi:hypothetical protein
MQINKEEFSNLTQWRKMVDEYSREFTRLARYAGNEVSTNAKKQARFRKGLKPRLKHNLNIFYFTNFQALVNKAIKVEHGNLVLEDSRKQSHDFVSSSSLTPQK